MYYLLYGVFIGVLFGGIDILFTRCKKLMNTRSDLLWVFTYKFVIGFMIGFAKFL